MVSLTFDLLKADATKVGIAIMGRSTQATDRPREVTEQITVTLLRVEQPVLTHLLSTGEQRLRDPLHRLAIVELQKRFHLAMHASV